MKAHSQISGIGNYLKKLKIKRGKLVKVKRKK